VSDANLMMTMTRTRALQQPEWEDQAQLRRVRAILAARPPLVEMEQIDLLRGLLAQVALGQAHVIQAGDCSEDPNESSEEHVIDKCEVLDILAHGLGTQTGTPVLRAGRIAGQFAKPRSQPVERVGDLELPVYRGHMVNAPDPDPDSRRADPLRLLIGYMAANEIMMRLGWFQSSARNARALPGRMVWTSHEALLLDYELPMVREMPDGRRWLSTTHWPWIGNRTRQVDGAHVRLLAEVANPVAVKIGPMATEDEVRALCEALDSQRCPGRLTLISRMGADLVQYRLRPLVRAVREAGHSVIWLCDPMHGNTMISSSGKKYRLVDAITREVRHFRAALALADGVAGGLHLETTTDDAATECVGDVSRIDEIDCRYRTFCDPRLTRHQALSVISAWND
jgi:3-deoxy-7-phosphoheptulonate synthase